jgi:CheY-like chemotaxis protein
MRVLLCDDEPSIRLLFRTALERHGLASDDIAEAVDGNDALTQATAGQHDVIVLDLFMPGGDGLAVLPKLRVAAPGARLYVVSAHASREAFEQGLAWGATGCFDKLAFLPRIPDLLGPSRTLTA